ncbi:MAG TPA: phage tail protein [Chloroflexia bacterium]|nr:phage tail protein [Chloroflexia bacterium]
MGKSVVRDEYLAVPMAGHDPYWWWLDARTGWRDALLDKVEQVGEALALSPALGSGRFLAEGSGSFGGLALPANVAIGPNGAIYLLDLQGVQLKRFDPCECRFEVVPCIAGRGTGVRQLLDPHGVGIMGGNIYICDSGNRQVKVFSLYGFALRTILTPPKSSPLYKTWQPYGVTFDSRGCIYVSDPANGMVHRFAPSGRMLEPSWEGLAAPTYMVMSCDGLLYVLATGDDGKPAVVVLDGEGAIVPSRSAKRPSEAAQYFPTLLFPVDAQGNIYLGALCAEDAPDETKVCPPTDKGRRDRGAKEPPVRGVFDSSGNPISVPPAPIEPAYDLEGYYYSMPLDSEIYRCQWHKIMLYGEIPAGARLRVWTYTAETEQTSDTLQSLPATAWATGQVATSLIGGKWDCLVRSDKGRYLWLKVQLRGDGSATPRITGMRVEYPRISLSRYLPAVFMFEPTSADFTDRFLSLFDTTLRSIEGIVDTQARFFDPDSTPSLEEGSERDFLSWLASWIGLTLDRHMPVQRRRQFVKKAARLYQIRGTREGLRRQLMLYLGIESAPGDERGGVVNRNSNDNDGEKSCSCACGTQPGREPVTCRPKPLNCAPPPTPPVWEPPPLILEHFQLRRWLYAGASKLGDQSVLWGKSIVNRSQLDENSQVDRSQLITTQDPVRDPFHVYAHKFTVFVPAWVEKDARYRHGLEKLLETEAPAHTLADVRYVQPRFRIGVQSTIGFDSVIGCYPRNTALGDGPLGEASVLSSRRPSTGGPAIQIGKSSRIR